MTNFANKYATRLAAYLENDATSCTVESVVGDPAVPYNAIIGRKGAFPDEIVTVTNVTGTTLTITRATEAVAGVQTAYDHPVGATFTAILTAASMATAFAGTAISDLDAVTASATTDEFVVNQGGTTKKATLAQVAAVLDGAVLDHVARTTTVNCNATTEGTAITVLTGAAITLDGSTDIILTVSVPVWQNVVGAYATFLLLDAGTVVGQLCLAMGGPFPLFLSQRLTPTAGSHTYSIATFNSAAGTAYFKADVGGSGKLLAAYLRIVRS